ncbi:MAG TPA: sigma-70 family RNA polymerase sigma factor [Acidimicrobiales bacterium]|jgi:RNA polymerase sigma-70 factor (ECF subfamily)
MTDASTFDELYRDTYRRLVVSLSLATGSREEAEDLAQEAFARTLVRWSRVRHGTNPAGYVYRVAFRLHRRSLLTRWRRRGALRLVETRAELQLHASGDLWSEVAAIRDIVDGLPLGCRRAAALCLYAEMTAEEAASVLGVTASTVRTQVQRARQAISAAVNVSSEEEDSGSRPSPAIVG